VAIAKVRANGFLHRRRDSRSHRLTRHFWRSPVGLEERHAIRTVTKMPPKIELLIIRQVAFDVIEAEVDELLTTNHAKSFSFRPALPLSMVGP